MGAPPVAGGGMRSGMGVGMGGEVASGMSGMAGGTGGPPMGRPAVVTGEPGVLPPFTSVTVRGLRGAAQHNGKVGQVESFDAESGRYAVRLADATGIQIKYDNVLQRLEAECIGKQSETGAEIEGKRATVCGYDEDRQRYLADIIGVGRASLQLANLVLPAGARGKVVGLTSAAGSKWNDQIGCVLAFDREAGRYLVRMTRDDQLKIKPVNFRL
jgi:hypothetical protein